MSADILRRAATVLRERASVAKRIEGMVDKPLGAMTTADYGHAILPGEADYVATFTPDVGLALADWLDAEAQHAETAFVRQGNGRVVQWHSPHAEAVARLILGGAS